MDLSMNKKTKRNMKQPKNNIPGNYNRSERTQKFANSKTLNKILFHYTNKQESKNFEVFL